MDIGCTEDEQVTCSFLTIYELFLSNFNHILGHFLIKPNATESPKGPGDVGTCPITVPHRKALRRRYYWCLAEERGGRGGVEWADDRRARKKKRPSLEMQRWKTPEERIREEAEENPGKSVRRRGHYKHIIRRERRRFSLVVSIQVAILCLFTSAWDSSTWVHAQG